MHILAIETSCDETAVAVVGLKNNKIKILSNVIASQIKTHQKYGGVVPEIAARYHAENIIPCLEKALKQAFGFSLSKISQQRKIRLNDFQFLIAQKIDALAATYGPGLSVALSVGIETAKVLSYVFKKPFIPVNHIEAHIYSVLGDGISASQIKSIDIQKQTKQEIINQESQISYPTLALIVSGGHTELILIKKFGQYQYLGRTLDDAAGEAFDKTAKVLGLKYPGGRAISALAKLGNPQAFKMPRPMQKSGNYNFSFSGLKTYVLYLWQGLKKNKERLGEDAVSQTLPRKSQIRRRYLADICASFEQAIVDVLVNKTIRAAKQYKIKTVILAGGVSANQKLRKNLTLAILEILPNTQLFMPNLSLCGDNATMVGIAGALRLKQWGQKDIFKVKIEPKLKVDSF